MRKTDRPSDTDECQRLIEDAGCWARQGERTFWNWYQTLTGDQRRVVKQYMESSESA